MTEVQTANGRRVWFDTEKPPTHWRCPHDRALVELRRVEQHMSRFHADCLSCIAEAMLCRALVDISSIRPGDWHGQ